MTDRWGKPIVWLTDAAEYFHHSGHPDLARACKSLLRKAGAALPRHRNRSQHLSPALATVGISDREAEVLDLIAQGLTSKEIAARLNIDRSWARCGDRWDRPGRSTAAARR